MTWQDLRNNKERGRLTERKIITIIGSTRFRERIRKLAWELTKEGLLVFFAPFNKEEILELENYREELEAQHFQKIRMADHIYVFNEGGYIGKSTLEELEYAKSLNKVIHYKEF